MFSQISNEDNISERWGSVRIKRAGHAADMPKPAVFGDCDRRLDGNRRNSQGSQAPGSDQWAVGDRGDACWRRGVKRDAIRNYVSAAHFNMITKIISKSTIQYWKCITF